MIDDPELGYTPRNLKAVRKKYGLTQRQVADITGTVKQSAVSRWEAAADTKNHQDMPYSKWLVLLRFLIERDF